MSKINISLFFIVSTIIIVNCKKRPSDSGYQLEHEQTQTGGLFRMVSDIVNNVIVPAHEKLYDDVKNLKESIAQECLDIRNFNRDELKKDFAKAMRSYHFTEAFQIGTIARDAYQMREKIYPWEYSNFYSVDREIAMRQKNNLYQYQSYPNRIGFPALEYLIFEDTLVNSCSECSSSILQEWNVLSISVKKQDRCHYMEYASGMLLEEIGMLRDSWLPVGGDITLSQAYQRDFKIAKEFAIKLTHALNFFDYEVKDKRLGVPSGINTNICLKDSCPGQSEHQFSQDSIFSLVYSTQGLLAIITGDKIDSQFNTIREGYGYEEWLIDNGHGKLAQEFKSRIIGFLHNLKKLEGKTSVEYLAKNVTHSECSQTTSENRTVEICALYKDLKRIMDIYKNDFLLALDWGRPAEQAGDTD